MLPRALILSAVLLLALAGGAAAERSVVLVIVDGMGSAYVSPGAHPSCADGSPLAPARLDVLAGADAYCRLWVPTPETECGHSAIVTGCSQATEATVSYYGATIFDALRREGYLCLAVMETGDTDPLIAEQDLAAHEVNNSAFSPKIATAVNGEGLSPGLFGTINDQLADQPRGSGAGAYLAYDNWSLENALRIVDYMNGSCPGRKYLLTVNAGGADEAAHAAGYAAYRAALEGLEPGLEALASACRRSGAVLAITADHGMSFSKPGARGAHASEPASSRNESRLVPLAIWSPEKIAAGGVFGQECLAPTLLELAGCPDTLSMEDGAPIPLGDRHTLYILSAVARTVSLEGPGVELTALVNGTWSKDGLAEGNYSIDDGQGSIRISLRGDRTIRLTAEGEAAPGPVPLAAYGAVTIVCLAGLAAVIKMTAIGRLRR